MKTLLISLIFLLVLTSCAKDVEPYEKDNGVDYVEPVINL